MSYSDLKNETVILGKKMRAEADAIYERMDSRALQGGATDDEAELLYSNAKKLFKMAERMGDL